MITQVDFSNGMKIVVTGLTATLFIGGKEKTTISRDSRDSLELAIMSACDDVTRNSDGEVTHTILRQTRPGSIPAKETTL